MVYDAESDAVLLFSGGANESEPRNDAWSYKTSTNTWTQLSPSPIFKLNSATDYDSKADRVVFYVSFESRGVTYRELGKTFIYDFNNDSLKEISTKETPVGLLGAQIGYDSESDRFILFGGIDVSASSSSYKDTFFDETWSYDLNTNTWTDMKPAQHPSGRNFYSMAYIPTIDRVILFGDGISPEENRETWLYDYNHNSWKLVKASNGPPGRYYSSMVYMSSIDRVLMYGGFGEEAATVIGDLWSFNPKTMTWEELHPSVTPGKRAWHAMAYDSKADKVVLFGGGEQKGPWTDETWIYDPHLNTWTDVTPKE
jgi:N-acetylneuraminic acid mutarotase